mmetsp:Transcript_14685/g.25884  ORF Transcript_14685/g.25884 Transcript_14685/m.25884 type:complete len:918 (+) Transcript_14685:243-2996(+)
MSNTVVDDSNYIINSTTNKGLRSTTPRTSSSSRVTRSQLEQQQKLRALYAESQNSDISVSSSVVDAQRVTGSRQFKENVNKNRQSIDSMSLTEERDDSKNGSADNEAFNNSAVTPSPKPDKGGSSSPQPPAKTKPESTEEIAARATRRAQWPRNGITEPGENDCLFGRGGGTNHHPGNKRYRKMVEDRKGKYLTSKRLDKPLVAMGIINDWRALDPPGRFLKQDSKTKFWDDVGDKKAREKTSQALREKTPVKGREGEEEPPHHGSSIRERTARFEPGTSSPVVRHVKQSSLARDHSLGETFVEGDITLEGFSWDDDSDRPVVLNANANVSPTANHQGGQHYRGEHRGEHHQQHGEHHQQPPPYTYAREHSLSSNPLSDATVAHPAPPAFGEPPSYYGQYYPGYGPPPPPPGHGHPPPPGHGHQQHPPPYHHSQPPPYSSPQNHHHANYSHHQPQQHRSREHSLQMNPLKGGSTSQPARDTFAEEDIHHRPPPLPSPTYDSHHHPPPLPPSYYGYAPSPQHGWPAPPGHGAPSPTPQFSYHPGSNPSAFGRYDSRSNSLRSLGSSVDAYYDRPDSGASSSRSPSHGDIISSAAAAPPPPPPRENPSSAGTSQDYAKFAELIRDSSDKTRSNSLDESNVGNGTGYEDTIQRSKSMPYEESGAVPSPRMEMPGKSDADDSSKPTAAASRRNVRMPSLLRKLSGGAMARHIAADRPVVEPINGGSVCRPEPVKRDTSNQPETLETKRSIKRVVLSRDQSAVSRRLKEEQKTKVTPLSKLRRAELISRKLSVEINKMGLDDHHYSSSRSMSDSLFPPLDRMTTEDVLQSLIDDDEQQIGSPSPPLGSTFSPPPKPLGEGDRMTTIDAIAMDIANGIEESGGDWDDTLDLMNEPTDAAPVVHNGESGGVNADIAEKWLKGET